MTRNNDYETEKELIESCAFLSVEKVHNNHDEKAIKRYDLGCLF